MGCVLPFNQIKLNNVILASPKDFVYGSGQLNLQGQDSAVTTADGRIHNYRSALTPDASGQFRGDARNKDTGAPETWDGKTWPAHSGTVRLEQVPSRGGTPVLIREFMGLVACDYDSNENKTNFNISGCDAVY